jgi:hypothetical protein
MIVGQARCLPHSYYPVQEKEARISSENFLTPGLSPLGRGEGVGSRVKLRPMTFIRSRRLPLEPSQIIFRP